MDVQKLGVRHVVMITFHDGVMVILGPDGTQLISWTLAARHINTPVIERRICYKEVDPGSGGVATRTEGVADILLLF